MSSRSILFTGALFAVSLGACSQPYSDVYSFKKNSFVAPPAPKTEVAAPNATANLLEGEGAAPQDGALPGVPGLDGGVPGAVPGAAPGGTGIPGLDPVPGAAPTPAPAPGADPAPAIPGL